MGLKKYFIRNKLGASIEAEEIFLDAEAARSIETKGKMERPIRRRNFIAFYCFIVTCLLIIFARAGYLQAIKGGYYHDLAQGNKLRIYPIVAPRGIIYDARQNPLVYNTPSFDIIVDISDFLANDVTLQKEIIEKINNTLNKPSVSNPFEELLRQIREARGGASQLIWAKNIDRDAALILESFINECPGVRLEKNIRREYIESPYFAHILGYTGQVNMSDLEKHRDYFLNDQIGKTNLEFEYETTLRGTYGKKQVEVNSVGRKQNILASYPAVPGNSLVLFLDKDLQIKLHQSLTAMLDKLKLKKAVGVVMDPRNGGILALVSLPSLDNNLFAKGISQDELQKIEKDINRPFLNRAIAGQYPSGSIIKPLIAAAALEENVIKPYQQINCTGMINIVNKYDPNIVYSFPDWKAHGLTDIIKAIAESCDVYFYTVGGGYGEITGLGINRIKQYLQYFGLGSLTGVDLPNEMAGLIPDAEWKKKNKSGEEWSLGDTYHTAIGQGDVLVTPMQMTSAISSVANGGTLFQAQLVDKIVDSDSRVVNDISPVVLKNNFVNADNLKIVRKGMREAVVSGSARLLSTLPVEAAGKTGTAQFGDGQMHAWFVGFAPYDDPQLVITILIEGGGEGSAAAVPVAKEVLEWYFNKDNL